MKAKEKILYGAIAILAVIVIVLALVIINTDRSGNDNNSVDNGVNNVNNNEDGNIFNDAGDIVDGAVDWRELEFTDVRTGSTFKISDFSGKPVIIHTFDLTCMSCENQDGNSDIFYDKWNNTVVLVSLDVNQRDTESAILSYIAENNYKWYFASVSESDLSVLNANLAGSRIESVQFVPRVLLCPDQKVYPISDGVKGSSSMKSTIDRTCYPAN